MRKKQTATDPIMYGKIPPQAADIEKAILGALILDHSCQAVGMSKLFSEIFYVDAHQKIFEAIEIIYDKGLSIDFLSVINQLKVNETLDLVGGPYYVTKLTDRVTSGYAIEQYILVISEMYLKRKTIQVCYDAVTDAYEDGADAFDIINRTDNDMQKMQERVISGMAKDMLHYSMKMIQQHDEVKATGVLGISTGIKALDAAICGLVSPDLFIIAARPGQGKTALALSITHYTSIVHNVPCAWFSLEMDGVQLVRRLVSIESGIDHAIIRNGKTTEDEYKTMCKAIEIISKAPVFIEDKTSITVRDIRTRANLLKKKHGIKYIVVDYIQLMTGLTDNKNANREQIVSEISRALKCLAKELQIPVIALSQLSRAVEARTDKMPQLSDLRESGAIEQDADNVVFLMRPEYYGMTESVEIAKKEYPVQGLTIMKVAKNRHGETCNLAAFFNGPTMHFYDNLPQFDSQNAGSWQKMAIEKF